MNNLQAFVDGMNAQGQKERAETQMTLGSLIALLKKMPQDMLIDGLEEPHSYRGYYSNLAFERAENKRTVAETLEMCQGAMGEVFEGYKGGDFMMGKNTPVWVDNYGSCGERIMKVDLETGQITTEDD